MPNESNSSPYILYVVLHLKCGRIAVHHGEDGVAALDQRAYACFEAWLQRLLAARGAIAADNPDHAETVGLRRREDLQRQRETKLAAVDHVGSSRVLDGYGLRDGRTVRSADGAQPTHD